MGLWDKFGEIWKNGFSFKAYNDVWDSFKGHAAQTGRGLIGGLWNTIGAAYNDDADFHKGMAGFADFGKGLVGWGGDLVTGAVSFPGIKPTFETLTEAQNQFVKRPLGTAALVTGDVARNYIDDANGVPNRDRKTDLFAADTWRRAYNATEKVSAGQALMYSGTALAGLDPFNAADREAGRYAGLIDPRQPAAQRFFHDSDEAGMWFSGTADAALNVFADPTIIGGKGLGAAKAAKLSKPWTAEKAAAPEFLSNGLAVQATGENAAHLKFIQSDRVNKLYDTYRNSGKSETELGSQIFNGVPQGYQMNGVLNDAAKVEDEDVSRRIFNNALLSFRGVPSAHEALIEDTPDIARSILNRQKAVRRRDTAAKYGEGDTEVDNVVDSRRETDVEHMMYAASQMRGIYGQTFGAAIGQNEPRLSLTSKWRVGLHQTFNGDPPMYLRNPVGKVVTAAGRKVLPSSTTTRLIDFNEANMADLVRANWERSKGLSPDRVAELTAEYGRASTPSSRFQIWGKANEEIATNLAAKHGFTRNEIDTVLPTIRALNFSNRASWTAARRYMPEEARKVAKSMLDRGDAVGAARAEQMADEMEASIKRGDQPRSVLAHTDIDGNVHLFPEDFDPAAHPAFNSQNAEYAAATDWRAYDRALWWHRKGAAEDARKGTYKVLDASQALLDAATSTFKLGAITRGGLLWRGPSDEVARALSMIGAGSMMSRIGGNTVRNVDAHVDSLAKRWRTRRPLDQAYDTVDGQVAATGTRLDPLGVQSPDGGLHYETREASLADGAVGVDDYIDSLLYHADNDPHALSDEQMSFVHALQTRQMPVDEFRKAVIDHALYTTGRDAYRNPEFRQQFLDQVNAAHAARDPKAGVETAPVHIDPYSGLSPRLPEGSYSIGSTRALRPKAEVQELGKFIEANHDELLQPNKVLHAIVSRSGKIRVGIATVATEAPVKPTAGIRVSGVAGKLKPDANGLVVNTAHGALRFDAAFEGGAGARFKSQVSTTAPGKQWMDREMDATYREMMHEAKYAWQDTLPSQPGYAESWLRAVNQIGTDPVGRMFLGATKTGKPASVDDVLQWLYHDPEGRKYFDEMGAWQNKAVERIQTNEWITNHLIPDDGSGAAKVLRRKVLGRNASIDDLKKVVKDPGDLPIVHGGVLDLAHGGSMAKLVNTALQKTFKVLQDKPADGLARFPLAQDRYELHLKDIAKSMSAEYARANQAIPAKLNEHIQNMARDRAIADVRKYMYDATTQHDVTRFLRYAVPFAAAGADAFTKWARIAAVKPYVPYNLWKAWTAPDHAGLTYDESGNQKRFVNGDARWFAMNPDDRTYSVQMPAEYEPKQEHVVFQLPSAISPTVYPGAKLLVDFNKDTFNTLLSTPTAGPLVTIPASRFAMKNPEFADNRFVSKFVLPLGPQPDLKNNLLPGYMRTAIDKFNDEEGVTAESQAKAIFTMGQVDYARGLRRTPITYKEAREAASNLMGIRFLSQWSGISPQFKSPYQPYIDVYRQMKAGAAEKKKANPDYDVDLDFQHHFGAEFAYLTGSVTRNQLGVPATIKGQKQYEKYAELMKNNPDLASWIMGDQGAGAFSQAVFQNQLNTPYKGKDADTLRYRQSLEQSAEQVQINIGWDRWHRVQTAINSDLRARGLTDINAKGAEDLKAARNKFIQANMYWTNSPTGERTINPWYTEYSMRDDSFMTTRLNSFANLIKDPRLSQRDDAQGIREYLIGRQRMKQIMAQSGFATLNSQKATGAREMWAGFVLDLADQNPAFASTYNRWLTSDQYLTAPFTLEGGK